MSSILNELYDWTSPTLNSSECQQAIEKQATYFEAIEGAFGTEFIEKFCDVRNEEITVSEREAFARGFRLCYQLLSELACDSKYSS